MALPPAALLPGVLLVADALALVLLGPLVPALAPMGVAGVWLEAALRLPFLAMAPRLLTPHRPPGATAAAVTTAATPAVFGTLRSLLGPPGAGPGLLAAAVPAWLGVTHATTALALLAWATPLMPGSVPEASPGVPKTPGGVPKAPAAFRRVLALAWSEWKVLGAAFLCLVLAATGETAGPYVTGKVLDAIRNRDGLTAGAVGMVVAAEAASVLFSGCRGWLFLLAAARLRQSLRLQLFSHLVHQDLDFFQGMPAAELSARFSTEVPLVSMAVPRGINLLLRSLGMALVVGMAMMWLAPGLALLALLELPLGITTRRIHSARKQALQRSMLEASARTASGVQESVAAIETIQIFSAEEEEEERHSQDLDKELRLKEWMELELAGFTLIHRVLRLAIRVLVLFRSHQQLRDGSITPGVLVTFLLYRDTVGSHIQVLLIGFNEFMTKMAAGQKIWEYLDQEPTRDIGGTLEPSKLRGDITFQRVCFTYPGHPERPVLKDVSFEVRSGEVTALAGPNGSGKSTAVALLERLRDPGSGKVLLDGIPLQEYEHQYLHRQVVLVEQDPLLFSGTIRENVVLGLERCEESELREAATAAGAMEFIQGLEQGWDTEVGELGGRLAVGERCRLALARALLRRPTVLILDEALDDGDEGAAQRWLRTGLARTVVVVSHRLRVLEAADRLVVLERGAVAEAGTPTELRERHGAYSRLLQGGGGTGRPDATGEGGRE
ncbi:PREDICTED: antigen peptide transporter 2-like [Lepidothrix coronata]|uniref:Antigen peptide transporter 2-like n=1 Tax=Lepidothrix coronata TaxID=321398 RepID=A0A6J0J7G2_9PASS|nr:PREDICTED: antigen peptide transporter 2-like [Lepidothrix coronata]XP_017694878.1 PREDICTED: antigen peptide transporter 2-like [Lepidothrix coronata]